MQSNQCGTCRNHYLYLNRRDAFREGIMPSGCVAYPDGIPPEVLGGEVDHRQPHLDDNDITWELAEGAVNPFDDMGEPDRFQATRSPQCSWCARLINEAERKCEAFDRIPDATWNGEVLHNAPHEGDGGRLFVVAPDVADVLVPKALLE